MTDEQAVSLSKRVFELLAFSVRRGVVYRQDRQTLTYSVLDNVPLELAKHGMRHAGRGHYVLVLEDISIKPDACRMVESAAHALDTMTDQNYLKFIKNVEVWRGLSQADFRAHLRRSFPSFYK